MDLLRCLVLIISLRNTLGTGFFISDDASSWITATTQCQLAEPVLQFRSDGKVFADISFDIDEDVWIGYNQERTAFEYLGCAAKDNNIPTFYTKADLGQCTSACGVNKIIGIFGNECFCFEKTEILDNEQTMLPKCKMECKDVNGVVCGGSSEEIGGTTYMSLYRSIGTGFASIGEKRTDKNCMYYDFRGFTWADCSSSYECVCGTDSTVWIENDNSNQPIYTRWIDATVKCLSNKTRPSTYNNTQYLQTNPTTTPLWTGIMRSQVIYKCTDTPLHLKYADMYGYITRDVTSSNVLKLSQGDIKKSLCVNVPDSFDVSTIVGASLSVIAVIVIVICLVLYVRKRGFNQPCRKQENKASRNVVQNDHAYVNTRPDEIFQSSGNTNRPDSAEINEATLTENDAQIDVINDASTSSAVYSNDYFVIEKKACESTKPGNLNSDPIQPYEKLRFAESPNYENYGNAQT